MRSIGMWASLAAVGGMEGGSSTGDPVAPERGAGEDQNLANPIAIHNEPLNLAGGERGIAEAWPVLEKMVESAGAMPPGGGKCCDDLEKANSSPCPAGLPVATPSRSGRLSKQEDPQMRFHSAWLLGVALLVACQDPGAGNDDVGNPVDAGDNSLDADGFIWGTEATDTSRGSVEAVNTILKTRTVKLRIFADSCTLSPGDYTTSCAIPSLKEPRAPFDLDARVKVFKDQGWSMLPMISYTQAEPPLKSDADIEEYASFAAWFVARYMDDAKIERVELMNSPNMNPAMLVAASTAVYDRIKSVRSSIQVGTPGFEYWDDPIVQQNMLDEVEAFLDPSRGAKFDFWAFHGYHLTEFKRPDVVHFPPNMKPRTNPYAGVWGATEIRRRLDANGWQARPIIDTEHVGILKPAAPLTADADRLDAAYLAQELLLKRTLRLDDRPVFAGAMPLKIAPRSAIGEFANACLLPDGSASESVKAVGLLWSKLNAFRYAGRVSGAYDDFAQVWVERFETEGRELYVFFKPFEYAADTSIALDGEQAPTTLTLPHAPASAVLTDLAGATSSVSPLTSIALQATNAPTFLEVTY